MAIIVATHNGWDYIERHLASWQQYGTDGHRVVVMETGASSVEYLDYLNNLKERRWGFSLSIRMTPCVGYDTGAYLWAYNTMPEEDEFLFCHDSMKVKRPGVMGDFRRINEEIGGGCVPWLVFRQNGYQNQDQVDFVSKYLPTTDLPGFGIFGPIFYTARKPMSKVLSFVGGAIPSNKNEQEAMERGWAIAFAMEKVPVKALDGDFHGPMVHNDMYPSFTKYLPQRQ